MYLKSRLVPESRILFDCLLCLCLNREEWLRCNGMPCEDKTLAEDLMEQLQYELTNSSYQSPESVRLHKTSNSLAMFIIIRNEVGTRLCFYTCL